MDLINHLKRQMVFSERTFGPGQRTEGVLDHIRKELCEIEAEPNDLEEWIDVVMLALDGAWRAGYSPEDIVKALYDKQTKNESRIWPDWRNYSENEAIEHIPIERGTGLYCKGDILRYGSGPTALMRVDVVYKDYSGKGRHRYYGRHCLDGIYGCYHKDASPATEADMETWRDKTA